MGMESKIPRIGLAADRGPVEAELPRRPRYLQVLGIARTYGLLNPGRYDFSTDPAGSAARAQQAENLRAALEEAGGVFVKIGQLLSNRSDLLPPEWLGPLSKLQESVRPVPWPEIAALIEAELGQRLHQVFAEVDTTPIAAASIAQVHRATLLSGEQVALKVQRPNIGPEVRRDVDIALRLAKLIGRALPLASRLGTERVAADYGRDLVGQLDFRQELANLQTLTATQAASPRPEEVRLPAAYPALSTRRLLTLEFLPGDTVARLLASETIDPATAKPALLAVLSTLLRQLTIDGIFHTDLHPGNVMLLPDGTAALVDFGTIGRLDRATRETMQELLLAYLQGDTDVMADALLRLVPLRDGASEAEYRAAIAAFTTHHLGPGAVLDVRIVDEAVELLLPYIGQIPPGLDAGARAFIIFEGTLRRALPGIDTLAEVRSAALRILRDQFRPRALGGLALDQLTWLLPALRRAPKQLGRITEQLASGDLSIRMRAETNPTDRRFVQSLVGTVLLTMVGLVAGVVAAWALTSPANPAAAVPTTTIGWMATAVSGVSFLAALTSSWLRGRRERRS